MKRRSSQGQRWLQITAILGDHRMLMSGNWKTQLFSVPYTLNWPHINSLRQFWYSHMLLKCSLKNWSLKQKGGGRANHFRVKKKWKKISEEIEKKENEQTNSHQEWGQTNRDNHRIPCTGNHRPLVWLPNRHRKKENKIYYVISKAG